MTAVPPLPLVRPRSLRLRPVLTHDQRRVDWHRAYVDPERVRMARLCIGLGRWAYLCGDPNAAPFWMGEVVRLDTARAGKVVGLGVIG